MFHEVFGACGVVQKLIALSKAVCCQVLLQHHTCGSVVQAMRALHGRRIYDGYCQLDIKGADPSELHMLDNTSCVQSEPSSVIATPKKKHRTKNRTGDRLGEFLGLYGKLIQRATQRINLLDLRHIRSILEAQVQRVNTMV